MDDLGAIRDRLEIQDLFSRYCFAIDARDGDAVADCFTPDGLFMSGLTGATRGRQAIRELMDEKKQHPNFSISHFVLNPIVSLDGDRATFRAYMLCTWVQNGKSEVSLTGRYRGTLVRHEGRWLFEERHAITGEGVPSNWGGGIRAGG